MENQPAGAAPSPQGAAPQTNLTDAKVEIPWREPISRLFLFRFLWMFIELWVIYVWSIWSGILLFLQFWFQLFTGKKHPGLWKRQVRFFRHTTKWNSYLLWLTDKRPEFIED